MRVTIRPAPHSKQCAIGAKNGCTKARNKPSVCAACQTCCERKHCVEIAVELAVLLSYAGHQVYVIGDEYALGYPSAKADANAYAAMAEVARIAPGLHIAIHTNSASASVRGVRIGYPKGATTRAARSRALAEYVAAENRKAYPLPDKVKTCTYDFLELNRPTCPALYIEAAFANSNEADARWIHGNIPAIAQSYAEGIKRWIDTERGTSTMDTYQATINCRYDEGIGLWDTSAKGKRVVQVPKGKTVDVLSAPDSKGFCLCRYGGQQGWADGQYLLRVQAAPVLTGVLDNLYAARTAQITARTALDAAIRAAGGE